MTTLNQHRQNEMANARSHGVFDAYFGHQPNPNPRWHDIALAAYTRCYHATREQLGIKK